MAARLPWRTKIPVTNHAQIDETNPDRISPHPADNDRYLINHDDTYIDTIVKCYLLALSDGHAIPYLGDAQTPVIYQCDTEEERRGGWTRQRAYSCQNRAQAHGTYKLRLNALLYPEGNW